MEEHEEIAIINRVLAGETDAFSLLVAAYQAVLLRVVAGVLNDRRRMAEEVAQDVFVEAFRRLPDFDSGRSRFQSWLLMIGRSRALNALRKKQPTYMAEVPEVGESNLDPIREEMVLLDGALHQLPVGQKRALLMSQVEGMTYRQIAEIEGVSEGTVKSRVSRARTFLKTTLQPFR